MNKPISYATFKNSPADFVVIEHLPLADTLTGTGEHLWLYLKKTGVNTTHLATLLAKWANIPTKHVGFSGIKDRHATTYQWFSLYVSNNAPDLANFETFFTKELKDNESVTLLKHSYHQKKLNRGTHKANHFDILLKDVKIDDIKTFDAVFCECAQIGFPNFFGSQRFGRDGGNLDKAHQLFAKAQKHNFKPKAKDSLIISSARSHIFNEILALRVANNTWHTGIDGDVFNLDGTGSLFGAELDETIAQRLKEGDIHPTAPLFGKGGKQASGHALKIEQDILEREDIHPLAQGLLMLTTGQRRALRVIPKNATYQYENNCLRLQFDLATGSFATSFLDFLVEELVDNSRL